MNLQPFEEFIFHRADVYCNQKYGDNLPYSFHLKCVEQQGLKFKHLLDKQTIFLVRVALLFHETIEDFRMTYNDVKEACHNLFFEDAPAHITSEFADRVADIVYAVTDEKGKTRKERKSEKYYKELSENPLAVFVKLADISANTLFSKLTGSSMYNKYKSEFSTFKEYCFKEEFVEFFDYVESL